MIEEKRGTRDIPGALPAERRGDGGGEGGRGPGRSRVRRPDRDNRRTTILHIDTRGMMRSGKRSGEGGSGGKRGQAGNPGGGEGGGRAADLEEWFNANAKILSILSIRSRDARGARGSMGRIRRIIRSKERGGAW